MNIDRALDQAVRLEHRLLEPVLDLEGSALVRALTPLAKLADEPPMMIVSGATIAVGLVTGRSRVVRVGARMFAAHLVANAAKTILKGSVDRLRPNAVEHEPRIEPGSGTDDKAENAFPSGHTAGAIAVAQAIAHDVPGLATPARVIAIVSGAMQVPRGAHYATDVLSGAAVGWLSERLAGYLLDQAEAVFRGAAITRKSPPRRVAEG